MKAGYQFIAIYRDQYLSLDRCSHPYYYLDHLVKWYQIPDTQNSLTSRALSSNYAAIVDSILDITDV